MDCDRGALDRDIRVRLHVMFDLWRRDRSGDSILTSRHEECPGRNIERSIHSKLHRGLTKNLGHPLGRIAFHNLFTGSEHLPSPADSNLVSGEGNSFRLRLKSKGKKGNKMFQRLKV